MINKEFFKNVIRHKCHDTKDCVVEDEALLLINQNKSNNFEVKSNNSQCIDCIHSEICQFYNALGAKVICYPCGFYEAKSNEELFKQALVEGVNRRIDKTIEEEKQIEQIEQIEEMAVEELATFLWLNTNMYDDDLIFDVAEALVNADYRKQSEGEWTYSENKKTMKCTRCRMRMKTYDVRRYCPNCGAKMKGGEKQ